MNPTRPTTLPAQLNEVLKVFVDVQVAVAALAVYPVLQTKVQADSPTSRPSSQVMPPLFWFGSVVPAHV